MIGFIEICTISLLLLYCILLLHTHQHYFIIFHTRYNVGRIYRSWNNWWHNLY